MSYKKKQNQEFVLKRLLMLALAVSQDLALKSIDGDDRIPNKRLLEIIKFFENYDLRNT